MIDSRTLLMVLDSIFLLSMTAWLGAILFFSFGIAPIIFKVLDASQAARFVRAIFPRYYAWGATSAILALASFTSGVLVRPEYRGTWALVQIVLILSGVLINFYCGNVLTPQINAARDAGPEQSNRFDQLHLRSVWLNGLMLLVGVVLLGAHAFRPDPRGPGVSEPTPTERARRSVERWQERSERWDREQIVPNPSPEQTNDP
ncbi:DUF4149 domain-containing protein [Tautonia rosea]|uniref:DUF4149 domain-containing protein n=1 Tax=Tautonia rosea TaxID=2728037 RepID=UPI00147305DD|nr:DUF4149 domain-containing protein [Tautonia rosea]